MWALGLVLLLCGLSGCNHTPVSSECSASANCKVIGVTSGDQCGAKCGSASMSWRSSSRLSFVGLCTCGGTACCDDHNPAPRPPSPTPGPAPGHEQIKYGNVTRALGAGVTLSGAGASANLTFHYSAMLLETPQLSAAYEAHAGAFVSGSAKAIAAAIAASLQPPHSDPRFAGAPLLLMIRDLNITNGSVNAEGKAFFAQLRETAPSAAQLGGSILAKGSAWPKTYFPCVTLVQLSWESDGHVDKSFDLLFSPTLEVCSSAESASTASVALV